MKTAGQKNQNIKQQKIAIGNDTSINLFTNIQYDEMNVLVSESFHCALLDSGCTQTVCGESWYNCYKENLTKGEASLMKELTQFSKIKIRFGNSNCVDIGQHSILVKKGTFEKKGVNNFSTPCSIPFVNVLHQNKPLHNFYKKGQCSIAGCMKGLDIYQINKFLFAHHQYR